MASALLPPTAPDPTERSPWQRWVGFWFPAADPTTLGFIRICTGLLVLYIHLSYSVDLQAFFGKQGWYATRYIDADRREYPWQASPLWTWDPQPMISARIPDFPHRRRPVLDFIRGLPAEDAPRREAIKFLGTAAAYEPAESGPAVAMLAWLTTAGPNPDVRERYFALMAAGRPTAPPPKGTPEAHYLDTTPDVLLSLPPSRREALVAEARAFASVLPVPTEKEPNRYIYVLNHLTEMSQEARRSFFQFLDTLPADKAARDKKIDYLAYWNAETDRSVRTGHIIFSPWFHVSDPTQMAAIHVGCLLVIVLFTLGLFTRVTSVLAWLVVVGYIHRTQHVLFGMDTMMNILMLYLMIGNSGAALSVDRLVARYRAARASLRRGGAIDAPTRAFLACPPPSTGAGFGLRLIQVHFCFIYVAAGLAKLKGPAWWDGRAFWDVVVNPEFTMMQYTWYEESLRAMARIKPVYHVMAAGGVWFTLFIEIAGPFLLWTRLRWLIIFLATLMHAIIGVTMGLNLFELLMIVMLIAFLPDVVVRDRLRGGPDLSKLAFLFGPSAHAARAAALVAAVDTEGQVALTPDAGHATPTVTADGKAATGPDGVSALFKSVRLLSVVSFLLWVPGVKGALTKLLFPAPAGVPPTTPAPPAPAAAS